jgi:hypothetical protein
LQTSDAPPPLLQFVLLSMLLHLLLIVLFGTSTHSGARRGDSLMGALDVTLRNLTSDQGSGFTIAPGADTKLPGAALLRRLEGSPAVPADSTPPVRRDAPSITAPSTAPPEPASTMAPSAPALESAPDVSISTRPPPAESLPKLDLNAPTEVDKPIAVPSTAAPIVSPPVIAPPVAPPPREPVSLPAPLERIAPAKIERQMPPPADLRPREVPVAPAKVESEPAPPVEARPREPPVPQAAPIERIAPPQFERQLAPPVEMPAQRQTPVEAAPPARVAPSAERESVPSPQPLPRTEAGEIAPARERATPTAPSPGKASAAPAPASAPANARSEPAKGGELPRLRLGAPDVDDEVFRSRRDGPAPADAPSGITGEAMRKRVREIASEGSGSRGVLNLVPPPPIERKDKLAEDIAKAAKPDCRTAYAGMGLLAVVPLVASAVGNGGCNW